MENLDGIQLFGLDFKPVKMGDLLYHEGPLLSHFVDDDNPSNHYFYKWSDCDDSTNRWMIFKVIERDLSNFFQHKINLLDIVRHNAFVYFIDLDSSLHAHNITLVATANIPSKYLPLVDSGFDEQGYEYYALELKSNVVTYRNILNRLRKELIKKVAF